MLSVAYDRLVLNLACCDLLTAAFNCPPTMVALLHDAWVVGDSVCQLNGVFTTLFGVASVMTLSVISLNRYMHRDWKIGLKKTMFSGFFFENLGTPQKFKFCFFSFLFVMQFKLQKTRL